MRSASYPFIGAEAWGIEDGPRVPLRVSSEDRSKSIITYALIDTGASYCVFPAELASYLDHDLKSPNVEIHKARTFNGRTVKTYRHTFHVEILRADHKTVIASNKMLVPCVPGLGDPLLGVQDGLCTFSVAVNYPARTTRLNWADPRPTK
ncbi:hypothetical protein ACFLSJ_01075 [Verrucomicrobiota bacterium]